MAGVGRVVALNAQTLRIVARADVPMNGVSAGVIGLAYSERRGQVFALCSNGVLRVYRASDLQETHHLAPSRKLDTADIRHELLLDEARQRLFIIEPYATDVQILDLREKKFLTSIKVPHPYYAGVLDERTGRLYLLGQEEDKESSGERWWVKIFVVDSAQGKLLSSFSTQVPLADGARYFAADLDSSGKSMAVFNRTDFGRFGGVVHLQSRQTQRLPVKPEPERFHPEQVALSSDGKTLYLLNREGNSLDIVDVTRQSWQASVLLGISVTWVGFDESAQQLYGVDEGKALWKIPLTGGSLSRVPMREQMPDILAVDFQRQRLYIPRVGLMGNDGVRVYDLRTNRPLAEFHVEERSRRVLIDPRRDRTYVLTTAMNSDIDTGDGGLLIAQVGSRMLSHTHFKGPVGGIQLDAANGRLYVLQSATGDLHTFDAVSGKQLWKSAVGKDYWQMALDAKRQILYLAGWRGKKLIAWDVVKRQTKTTTTLAYEPTALALNGQGLALVYRRDSGNLSVFAPLTLKALGEVRLPAPWPPKEAGGRVTMLPNLKKGEVYVWRKGEGRIFVVK